MDELLFGGMAPWFTIPALVGTTVFLFKGIASLMGGGDGDIDIDPDIGAMHGGNDHHHDASADALKLISVQTLSAFALGFGWVGLAAYRGADLTGPMSLLVALGAGVGVGWLMAHLLRALYRIQSSGNIEAVDLVSREADIDVRVPAARRGVGQVRIVLDDRMRSHHAVTDDAADLERNARVMIVGVNADNTLTVTRL